MSGDVFTAIETRLAELSRVDTDLRTLEADKDREVKEIVDVYAPKITPLAARRDELMAELAKLWVDNESVLTSRGKTVSFRSGTLSSRMSQGSLVVEDEAAVMRYLRHNGLVRRFTKLGKRTINKEALKKHPEIVAKIRGLFIDTPERLHVKLARTEVELKQPLHPFRVRTK